jgi:mannose-1-phosphate guanylyltransferase
MQKNLYIFIMAGGSGERFWPASRTTTPKHLLKLLGEQTLLEQTVRRFEGVVPLGQIFILTNSAQVESTKEAIPFLPAANIIAEPAKRDTAPACALATAIARTRSLDAVIGLFPADAMIHDVEVFRKQIKEAALYAAENEAIVTFSITPSYPSTGFGYLKLGEQVQAGEVTQLVSVSQFVEKPNSDRALEYLESGKYGWNAGMFLWKAETFYRECEKQQPELAAFIDGFTNHQKVRLDYLATAFPSLPKISVDFAIMEHASSVVAVIADFDWDDVGSWTALPKHLGTDEFQNTFQGNVISLDSTHNIVVANKRVVAICGVSDLVVVESHDSILVCHRNAAEKIKQLTLPAELK